VKQLEMIHVRLVVDCPDELGNEIRQLTTGPASGIEVAIYRRSGVSNDLGVFIVHDDAIPGGGPSRLGVQLASELRQYGMVAHSTWSEL